MRSKLGAFLQFGMVYVPVGLASSASRKDIKLRQLHVDCATPIKQAHRCEVCNKTLEAEEVVKGFEVTKGQFVFVDTEEMAKWSAPRTRVIELEKFIPAEELTPWMIDKTDWLIPTTGPLSKPYYTLELAMWGEKVVGIGTASLYGKEHPIAVSATNGALMLHTLFAEDELVPGAEISAGNTEGVVVEEEKLTREFIRLRAGNLEAGDLHNETRERQMSYINALALGELTDAPQTEPAPVPSMDYMALVKEAIEKAEQEKATATT